MQIAIDLYIFEHEMFYDAKSNSALSQGKRAHTNGIC